MYEYHLHSHFSGDCTEEMEATIRHAIALGGKQLCFTDHLDYDYPTYDVNFEFDAEGFSNTLAEMQVKYPEITIHKGIELGLQPHIVDKCTAFVKAFQPDFVLCSFHVANREDLYNGDFYRDKSPDEAWKKYFEDVYKTLKSFKEYSVVGHLDIPKRYDESTKSVPVSVYRKELEKVLKLIIEDGKGIEVNMSGLRTDAKEPLPNREILEIYYALGGRIITIGSDAHVKEDIYSHFDEMLHLLNDIGFDAISTYEKMKRIPLNIKKVLEQL